MAGGKDDKGGTGQKWFLYFSSRSASDGDVYISTCILVKHDTTAGRAGIMFRAYYIETLLVFAVWRARVYLPL